jgi:phosphonate ABC transporter permease subunit PhnE
VALLSIEQIDVRAPAGATILRGLSLAVEHGERVAVVGRSGAGKTTLFRTINGTMVASAGRVLFDGEDVGRCRGRRLRQLRRRIGVIAQKHDLVEPLRVHQNVMAGALGRWSTLYALRYLAWPPASALSEAEEALAQVGLAHKLQARTTGLSGGEQQRVAIARALVQAPEMILADEPVASLDPHTAEEVLTLLCTLAERRRIAVVCSLHQPERPRATSTAWWKSPTGGRSNRSARQTRAPPRRSRSTRMSMSMLWQTARAFWPPDVSLAYLLALREPVLESLEMSAAAMLVAFAVSLPLGLAVATGVRGAALAQRGLATLRSIPDLTMAIFCVVLFGIGPAAGVVALAIFYTAAVAKMFGDLLRTAPPGPVDALRATGAGRVPLALFGLIPITGADLLTYGSYEFESAVRASVIVGSVGGGGLGTELVGSLSALDYHRTTTLIIVLVLVVAAIDRAAVVLRRHPILLWLLLPLGFVALAHQAPRFLALTHAVHTFAAMFPPQLSARGWAQLPRLVAETIAMAVGGTAFAFVFAVPLGFASARNIASPWLAVPVRRGLEVLRAIPEVVWGLLLIVAVGVGPVAGTLALGLHSLGSLGRLFAESFENVPRAPLRALAATGAAPVTLAMFGTLPLAGGTLAAHTLFRFEWNLRMATVAGLIGAGGVGQALFESQQLMFYRTMMAYVIVTVIMVATADLLNERTRRRFGWSYGAR